MAAAEKTMPLVEVLPATPSLQDLNQMTDPIVVVTKILKTGTNREESQLVINGKHYPSVDKIIELQDLIPRPEFPKGGPGTYKFEVVDGASGARVAWKIRLGQGDSGDLSVSSLPSSSSHGSVAPLPPPPLSSESQSLGNGWVFNSTLNVLTSPSGKLYSWHKGQPLPEESYPTAQFNAAAPATSIGQPLFPVVNPEIEAMRRSLEATQAQLNEAREQQKEQAHREELGRIQESFTRTMTEMQTRYETMIAKFSEQPKVDPKLELLERQLEEQKRDRAERERLESIRGEMGAKLTALENALRDSTSKTDPMVPFLTQFIAQMQQSNQNALAMMRESSQQQLTLAAQNTLTPEKLLLMLREQAELAQNSGSSLMNEKVMGFMNTMLDTALRFQRAQSEFSGGNNGVDWASLISSIGERAGGAIQAIAQARMREASATEAKAKAVAATAKARGQQLRSQPQPQPQQLPAASPEQTGSAANDALRDRLAEQMGMIPKAAEEPEESEEETPETVEPTPPVSPAVVQQQLEQLRAMRPGQLRKMLGKASDDAFFGSFLSEVQKLRDSIEQAPDAYTADDIAKYVLEARAFIADAAQADGKIPIVIEMFGAERYEYLIERLLPKISRSFRTDVVTALREQLAEEETSTNES